MGLRMIEGAMGGIDGNIFLVSSEYNVSGS